MYSGHSGCKHVHMLLFQLVQICVYLCSNNLWTDQQARQHASLTHRNMTPSGHGNKQQIIQLWLEKYLDNNDPLLSWTVAQRCWWTVPFRRVMEWTGTADSRRWCGTGKWRRGQSTATMMQWRAINGVGVRAVREARYNGQSLLLWQRTHK